MTLTKGSDFASVHNLIAVMKVTQSEFEGNRTAFTSSMIYNVFVI